jgi:hypothetical protein
MKLIVGMLRNKKVLAGIIVIVIVIAALVMIPANAFDAGAPEANILCTIQAVGSNDGFSGDASVGEESLFESFTDTTNSMTTFTSNIPTLDANTQYSISFTATMTTKTAKFGEALTNAITVTGLTGGSASGKTYLATSDISSSSASVAGTAGSSSTLSIPGFVKRTTASTPVVITGDVIDGSVFTFTITSTSPDARTSSTTATLGITVTSGGTIYLTVNSITTTVQTSAYPVGWNVPGNVNYIVLSGTDPSYVFNYYVQTTGSPGSSAPTTLSILKVSRLPQMLSLGYISQIQYDCGMAQITALGG